MSHQYSSAVYHLDFSGRIPSGQLIHVEDHPGEVAEIYLHRLHVRSPLLWQINWLTRQQVGYGLWRQRWTEDGRMCAPAEGLGVAVSRWDIVPASEMPSDCYVFPVEDDGSCVWLIRVGYCTVELQSEMNRMLERIAGDGLWLQDWYGDVRTTALTLPAPSGLAPVLTP
ncbi:hypothetical protein [Streptomyces sp.]|uniref:hypothetical protein n=1 Tax=Streptomyces sp. TaxID=1931 RepID=UPI002D5BD0E5|nr:hypothetical protein [Streptomyces sp.]HZF92098.1 hypothetical protein [Streptomyces sp.]